MPSGTHNTKSDGIVRLYFSDSGDTMGGFPIAVTTDPEFEESASFEEGKTLKDYFYEPILPSGDLVIIPFKDGWRYGFDPLPDFHHSADQHHNESPPT